ncbi:MAG: bifunctional folylpolyglutamate synthase/dihydrofolate synthase [Deltaproteobacteria bacterium]|jgi:dihydrofolate synthase/folylpolyglutamate synthase|nr:bifunctional folylpolyglutamate synthase/dihydrofolate synthase [Deltaproteobacteria bacterium]
MEATKYPGDYHGIIARLFELQKFGMKFGLESMERILDNLDRPHDGLRLVHVAGTNGKGSTAAMLAAGLKLAGFKVGLYTSPHLITFRERIQLDGDYIPELDVASMAAQVWPATDPASPPTFFEFVTAMAFLFFKREKADLAVIETGLGGRLDSTNVIRPLVSGITNVSLEHTDHLGKTIEAIAFEKAGVIKPGTPFVGGRLDGPALDTISSRIAECGCPTSYLLGRDYEVRPVGPAGHPAINYHGPKWRLEGLPLALAGPFQADNAAMALALAETLAGLGYDISPEAAAGGLSAVRWPGRAETFAPGAWPPGHSSAAPLILDGAHNPAGALALASLIRATPRRRLHLIVGVMADKDIGGVLGPIIGEADRLYLTRPAYHRAASPELLLSRIIGALGPPDCPHSLHPSIPEALEAAAASAGPEDLVVLSGSLFTVGETRAYLTGAGDVESN